MNFRKLIGNYLFFLAKHRGYEVIPFWKMHEISLVNHLRKVLELYNVKVVIDVGANKGQFHDLLRQDIGFRGQILSFEPVSRYYDLLMTQSSKDSAWKIFNFALGSERGEAEINVTQSPGLNSFLAPRNDVVDGYWQEGSILGVEMVQIKTLDEVLAVVGLDCSTTNVYLKLDTQGFDLEVLKGAKESLPKICGLQTEASIRPIYEGMPTYIEVVNFLTQAGFDISGMFPVTHDDSLRVIEFDFLFVNGACHV
jgi:FkbM family methyltransferase